MTEGTLLSEVSALMRALSVLRVPATPGEYDLHALVGRALAEAGIACRHEVPLAPRCRIDFVAGRVGIEVKKGSVSARELTRQGARYLASDALDALLLVTTRGASLPPTLSGKPVYVYGLNRLWGIAL